MIKKLLLVSAVITSVFAQEKGKSVITSSESVHFSVKEFDFKRVELETLNEPKFSKRTPQLVTDDSTGYYFSTNEIANQELAQPNNSALEILLQVADINGTDYFLGGTQLVPNTHDLSLKSVGIAAQSIKTVNSLPEDANVKINIYNKDYSNLLATGTTVIGQNLSIYHVDFTNPAAVTDSFWVEIVGNTVSDAIRVLGSNDYSSVPLIEYEQFGFLDGYDPVTKGYVGQIPVSVEYDYLLDLVYNYTLNSVLTPVVDCNGLSVTLNTDNNPAETIIKNPIFSFGKWMNDLYGANSAYYAVDWGDNTTAIEYLLEPTYNYNSNTFYNIIGGSTIFTWNQEQVASFENLEADLSGCQPTGFEEKNLENVSVYPNPSSNTINFQFQNERIGTIKVMDLFGRKVLEQNFRDSKIQLNITNLQKGVYYFQIINNNIKLNSGNFSVE